MTNIFNQIKQIKDLNQDQTNVDNDLFADFSIEPWQTI